MGNDLVTAFTTIRRDEVDKWRTADGVWDVRSVSDWELETYLPFY
jgi:hypothetical protein